MRQRGRDAGYTLIELLVALAVLALLALLLVAGVGATRLAGRGAGARAAGVDGVAAAQGLVRARLEALTPLTRYDASRPYADVQGTRDTLFWLGPLPEAERPGEIAAYRLSMSTGSELVLSTTADLSPEDTPNRRDRVLMRGVAGVEFGYFGAAPPDGRRGWRDEWRNQPRPPELIRVRVTLPARDRRRWPELLVAPGPTIDTSCLLNLETRRCKGR